MEAGDFEEFFRSLHPRLVRYAKRRIDAESALDVASQAMHTLWCKQLPAPASELERRKLESLAYRVLEGHIRNALRGRRRLGRVADAVADEERHGRQAPDVADLVVEGDAAWLERLSLTDREVLSLLADGYAVAEIAVILDCTPGAVSMRLQRARKNLRILLARLARDDH